MNKKEKKLIISYIIIYIILMLLCTFFCYAFAYFSYEKAPITSGYSQEKLKTLHEGAHHIMLNEEDTTGIMNYYIALTKISYLEQNCHCQSVYKHIKHPGCSLSDGWANVKYRCPHSQVWDELFALTSWWATSNDLNTYTRSELLSQLKNWLSGLGDSWTISQLMEFLNDEQYEYTTTGTTGWWNLRFNPSFFCLKHGQAIGSYRTDLQLDHGDSYDLSKWYDVSYDEDNINAYCITGTHIPTLNDYWDEKNYGGKNSESPKYYKSNVKYSKSGFTNIYDINNGFGSYHTNVFSYATAYTTKNKNNSNPEHNQEGTQLGIWAVVGSGGMGEPGVTTSGSGSNTDFGEENGEDSSGQTTASPGSVAGSLLYRAGAAVDEYEMALTSKLSGSKSANHFVAISGTNENLRNDVSVKINKEAQSDNLTDNNKGTVSDSTGTTIFQRGNTQYYKIGPFKMGDYALAYSAHVEDFSGYGLKYPKEVGGIIDGTLTFVNDSGNDTATVNIGSDAKIVYTDMRGNATNKGNNIGNNNYSYIPGEDEYCYPYANSTFYIEIEKSKCGTSAVQLKNMAFTYRQTLTDGNGWVIRSKYVMSTITRKDTGTGCTTYSDSCHGNSFSDNIGGTHSVSCTYTTGTAPNTRTVTHNPSLFYTCSHGHEDCNTCRWDVSYNIIDGQPFLAVHDSKVQVRKRTTTSEVNIRLTTNVTINKYIYDVAHKATDTLTNSRLDTTIAASKGRSSVSEETKKNNPVYVEYGDTVTYYIELINSQNQEIELKLKDSYPNNSTLVSIKDLSNNSNVTKYDVANATNTFTTQWIKVPRGTKIIEVKVLVNSYQDSESGLLNTNTATIITRNSGYAGLNNNSVDYMRTTVTGRPGPVVNLAELNSNNKMQSSDYYRLNDYNAFIDKYVYAYDESQQELNNQENYTNDKSLTTTKNQTLVGSLDILNVTRERWSNQDKVNKPLSVEKGETITYAIKIKNEANTVNNSVAGAKKPATQVRTTEVVDYMQVGLTHQKVVAVLYNSDGSICNYYNIGRVLNSSAVSGSSTTINGVNYKKYTYKIDNSTILNPGQYIIYYVTARIDESNMYLYQLNNTAELSKLTNINNTNDSSRVIMDKTKSINRNISQQQSSSDYVRMKDFVIGGLIWLDLDRDGYMNDSVSKYAANSNFKEDQLKTYYNINEQAMKKDIVVKLYRSDGTLLRTTLTDEKGQYTFGKNENMNFYPTLYNYTPAYNPSTIYQRIDKATNKDSFGNYTEGSEYIGYYVEYEYDGVVYKSTENCSSMKNLNTKTGDYNTNYLIDSNAREYTRVREEFNQKYEYITNDLAYGNDSARNVPNGTQASLAFDKTDHTSQLIESDDRIIASRSFVDEYSSKGITNLLVNAVEGCRTYRWKMCGPHYKYFQVFESLNLLDDLKYENTEAGRIQAQIEVNRIVGEIATNTIGLDQFEMTKLLWLCAFDNSLDNTIPNTDYLKHINLGLELREDVDVSLTKDVYSVVTHVNGQEIEYDLNQNTVINGSGKVGNNNSYLQDYIVTKPYGIDLYESDFKYRVEQYDAQAVKDYKGTESELETEVTYRITINNNMVSDDNIIKNKYENKDVTETSLDVKINEIVDLYDQNFVKFSGKDKDDPSNLYTVKTTNAEKFLENKKLRICDAWYFEKNTSDPTLDRYSISNQKEVDLGAKPIYIENVSGEYIKRELNLSNDSNRYSNRTKTDNNFADDGYNILYITGMENVVISEGSAFDIYVKYTVDKDSYDITVSNEILKEEITNAMASSGSFNDTYDYNGRKYYISYSSSSHSKESISKITTNYQRTLSIKELVDINTHQFKKLNGRGTENLAQINAYSIWYTNGKPASLVDMDSNAGNLGATNSTIRRNSGLRTKITVTPGAKTSADDKRFYEDNFYKTGVEITSDYTNNTIDLVEDKEAYDGFEIFIKSTPRNDTLRKINGTVWDDSRTATIGNGSATQYVGNGILNSSDTNDGLAKTNENVEKNYKDGTLSEKNDIKVEDELVEYVEIVQTAPTNYYEQILKDVTWEQVQKIRSNENGDYTLTGMIPGRYIVRFTYGSLDEKLGSLDLNDEQKNMLIFNGQDYKSTQYNSIEDTVKDDDLILKKLEESNISDARDDELRRLQVNEYSEVMTNYIAEILKGVANNTVTNNSNMKNSIEQLEELAEKTNMYAETVEFLVKPEYPKAITNTYETWFSKGYIRTKNDIVTDENMLYQYLRNFDYNDVNTKQYNIDNIDFGIEYRPEAEISLIKEIDEIKLTTEDNEVLADLFFKKTNENSSNIIHELDMENSIGIDKVQFNSNEYTNAFLKSKLNTEALQGFVYLQIDDEILHGSTVEITYRFYADNHSEVDRISETLNSIRYKNNIATQALLTRMKDKFPEVQIIDPKSYTANDTAYNVVYAETYGKDRYGYIFRNKQKTLTTNPEDPNNGYYGKFIGYSYYNGEETNNAKMREVVSELKFDKILDYVDTDLEFKTQVDSENLKNRFWTKVNSNDLTEYVLRVRKENLLSQLNTESLDNEIEIGISINEALKNVKSIKYESMVVSVDDRMVDIDDTNESIVGKEVNNDTFSRFLTPKVYNEENSRATIYLPVSKVLSAESLTDAMTYENIAEVIQYTTLTGRRTNFETTIGNADINNTVKVDPNYESKGSIEFATASYESDTAGTETVTLIPPTGLMLNRKLIVDVVDKTKTGAIIASIGLSVAVIGIIVTNIVVRKYKKRRIK